MITSLAMLDAADMFVPITVLSMSGVGPVYLILVVESRVLHWSPGFREG